MIFSRMASVLAAAAVLSACGGGEPEQDAGSGEPIDVADAARMMEGVEQPLPGEYRTRMEMIDFEIEGLPDAQAEQMRSMMGGQPAMENTFCLTPEEAEQGPERMVQEMASADCVFDQFEASGNSLTADMRCTGEGGVEGSYQLEGQMAAESSDMRMRIDQGIPGIPGDGRMRMEMRLTSTRTGDCS